jgi:hypothetical protein
MKQKMSLLLALSTTALCPVLGQISVNGQGTIPVTEISTVNNGQIQEYKGIPVQPIMGSMVSFGGLEGMIERADLIVIGQVEKTIEETPPTIENETDGVVSALTYVPLTIKKVFKGDPALKNQQVVLGQQASILKDKNGKSYASIYEGFAPFQKAKYLVFLVKSMDGKAYFPVGVYYGKYNLDGLDREEAKTQNEEVKSFSKILKERFKDTP